MARISIVEVVEAKHVAQVEALLRDYLLWMRRRYGEHAGMIDDYLDGREWESELADLPGHYGAPHGGMVLALVDGMLVGCVLLRGIGENVGEMKRLFVRPAFHDIGIACALVRRLAELALVRGYKTLKLETGPLHKEAQTLYRALGFQQARAHHEIADRIASHMLFFEAGASHVAHRAAQTVDKARWRHEQPWQRPWAALCARLDSWYLMPDTGVPGARTNEFFHRQHRRACPLTFVAPGLADPR